MQMDERLDNLLIPHGIYRLRKWCGLLDFNLSAGLNTEEVKTPSGKIRHESHHRTRGTPMWLTFLRQFQRMMARHLESDVLFFAHCDIFALPALETRRLDLATASVRTGATSMSGMSQSSACSTMGDTYSAAVKLANR